MKGVPVCIGSVSEATLNPRHLLPALSRELEALGVGRTALVEDADALIRVIEMLDEEFGRVPDIVEELAHLILDELFDELNEYAPPYTYFGANESDGASFGWWVSWDTLETADDVLKVSSLKEIPTNYDGLVLLTNDLVDGTMYDVEGGEVKAELWSL